MICKLKAFIYWLFSNFWKITSSFSAVHFYLWGVRWPVLSGWSIAGINIRGVWWEPVGSATISQGAHWSFSSYKLLWVLLTPSTVLLTFPLIYYVFELHKPVVWHWWMLRVLGRFSGKNNYILTYSCQYGSRTGSFPWDSSISFLHIIGFCLNGTWLFTLRSEQILIHSWKLEIFFLRLW